MQHTMILVKEHKHVRMNCFQGHSKHSQQQTVCTGNYATLVWLDPGTPLVWPDPGTPLVWLDPGTPSTDMSTVTVVKAVGGVHVPSAYGS